MANSFAHLVGLGRRPRAGDPKDDEEARRRAAEPDDKECEEYEDDDEEMRRLEDDGKDTGEKEDDKARRHAREERRAKRAEEDREEEEDGDDEGDREEAHGQGTVARARRRERGRIGAILSSPQAAQNLGLAVELACNTSMSRDQAVRVLSRAPAAPRADRVDRNPRGIGSGSRGAPSPATREAQLQDMWGEAFARANPALRRAAGPAR